MRDAAAGCATEIRSSARQSGEDAPEQQAATRAALAGLDDLVGTAERILVSYVEDLTSRTDVVWMDRPVVEDPRRPATLRVAPLQVGALLAERLFRRQTVVLTSATLALGGSFEPLARQWGLPRPGTDVPGPEPASPEPASSGASPRPASPDPPGAAETDAGQAAAGAARPGREPTIRRAARPSRPRTAWPGPAWTSARPSTILTAASCTSPSTCPRPAATGSRRPT